MNPAAPNAIHWDGEPMNFGSGAPPSVRAERGRFEDVLDAETQKPPTDNGAEALRQVAMHLMNSARGQALSALSGDTDGVSTTYQWLGLMAIAAQMQRTQDVEEVIRPVEPYRPGSRFDEMIGFAARRFGLPERVIHAIVRAESNYNPEAVSPAGARGLMQLMPGTASALGVNDSFDPLENIMGGARYIRQMLDRYQGNLRAALAAYNWGPGNVDAKGLDRMPEETRNYTAYILRLLQD